MANSGADPKTSFARKGRGSSSNPDGRFETYSREACDDGWGSLDGEAEPLQTTLGVDSARSVISRNDSPDVPFEQSINPYRGCEHGCVYCFARPTHGYLGLSAGLDFESRLFYKADAAARLEEELRAPGYRCRPIALGINTDAYQPVERRLGLTREILQVLQAFGQPVSIVTKSALIERDLDILAPMAEAGQAEVMVSITGLDRELSRRLEPRAAAPERRLQALHRLSEAGVPTGVLFAPVIPALNDAAMEWVLEAAASDGARSAGYVVLRLPHEVKELFGEWLQHHEPLKAQRVLAQLRSLHGGRLYEPAFGRRLRGSGPVAEVIAQRFRLACRRLGLDRSSHELDCSGFRVPPRSGDQLQLL